MNGEFIHQVDAEALARFMKFSWRIFSSPVFLILVVGFFSVLLWATLRNLDSKK